MSRKLQSVYKADDGVCWLCGKLVERVQATIDHVWPKRMRKSGGSPVRLAHRTCNRRKADDDPTPYIEAEQKRMEEE